MVNRSMGVALGVGTALQVLMVVVGHFLPGARDAGLFPIGGTLLGGVTGWLAGRGATTPGGAAAGRAGLTAGLAGGPGSLVSTALGDVPVANVTIAAGATAVAGAIGALLNRRRGT